MFGAVSFKDGSRHGSAGHVKFLNGGDNVELENLAKVVDAFGATTRTSCGLNARENQSSQDPKNERDDKHVDHPDIGATTP